MLRHLLENTFPYLFASVDHIWTVAINFLDAIASHAIVSELDQIFELTLAPVCVVLQVNVFYIVTIEDHTDKPSAKISNIKPQEVPWIDIWIAAQLVMLMIVSSLTCSCYSQGIAQLKPKTEHHTKEYNSRYLAHP